MAAFFFQISIGDHLTHTGECRFVSKTFTGFIKYLQDGVKTPQVYLCHIGPRQLVVIGSKCVLAEV
jgi:hypothetical protein